MSGDRAFDLWEECLELNAAIDEDLRGLRNYVVQPAPALNFPAARVTRMKSNMVALADRMALMQHEQARKVVG